MFTDIVGFTEFTALQGDEQALELLGRQERIVQESLPAGARIVKELGDGLLLWFPDVGRALEACLGMQRLFEEQADGLLLPLGVRIGMHFGRPRVRGDDLIGHDVNVAARIVDVAGPGEVLLSEEARLHAGDVSWLCSFDEIGPVVMKGLPEPIRLFRAVNAARGEFETGDW
ncbi:MAG: hypothetical protein Kow0010_15490 [Dehalococcoidia bacterium]